MKSTVQASKQANRYFFPVFAIFFPFWYISILLEVSAMQQDLERSAKSFGDSSYLCSIVMAFIVWILLQLASKQIALFWAILSDREAPMIFRSGFIQRLDWLTLYPIPQVKLSKYPQVIKSGLIHLTLHICTGLKLQGRLLAYLAASVWGWGCARAREKV